MALALEKGSEMTAPLGRAVIGGLVVSTFATLLVVPAIFALLLSRVKYVSPSIDPDDPASRHYDPLADRAKRVPTHDGPDAPAGRRPDGEKAGDAGGGLQPPEHPVLPGEP